MAVSSWRGALLFLDELGAIVLLRLQRRGGFAGGAVRAPLFLARRPLLQARVRGLALLQHLELVGQLRRELQPDAVRVEEVNAVEDVVVRDAEHLDAMRL